MVEEVQQRAMVIAIGQDRSRVACSSAKWSIALGSRASARRNLACPASVLVLNAAVWASTMGSLST